MLVSGGNISKNKNGKNLGFLAFTHSSYLIPSRSWLEKEYVEHIPSVVGNLVEG